MKKITLSVILLGFTFNNYSAQQVTVHIENTGIFYVEKNALINVKGGIQIKGKFKNKGNVMLEGFSDSVFKTLKEDGSNVVMVGRFFFRLFCFFCCEDEVI